MYAIIKLENQRHPTYILMNTLGMSQVQNTSFLREESFIRKLFSHDTISLQSYKKLFNFPPPTFF